MIRLAGAKVAAPGQTCSQAWSLRAASGKVWVSTFRHRGPHGNAIGCGHSVSEGRTDFTCMDCFVPLACRLATYWQEGGVLKPASNLLSPCIAIARLGKQDILIGILYPTRTRLAGLSRTVRETIMISAEANAHISVHYLRSESVSRAQRHVIVSTQSHVRRLNSD